MYVDFIIEETVINYLNGKSTKWQSLYEALKKYAKILPNLQIL